jgi:hypothetical protein
VWLIVAAAAVGAAGAVAMGWALTGRNSDDESRAAEYCQLDERVSAVRWAVYGPPFSESTEEIEALLAEAHDLETELDRLTPDEIRHVHDKIIEEFVDPIDALTEELGWDPYAAINTGKATAIFEDRDINAAMEELWAFKADYCFVEEDLDTPTEPLTIDGKTIAIYNGTPALNDALAWGLQRFAEAGLEVPEVASATFTVQSDFCDDIRAHYLRTEVGVELEFCMDEQSACRDEDCNEILPGWSAVVLHEIAHAWLDTHLDVIDIERFLDHVGLDTWRDPDLPWEENGVEHAADTIAWGLMDRDVQMLRIGQPTAGQLAEGFAILTGIEPLPKDT